MAKSKRLPEDERIKARIKGIGTVSRLLPSEVAKLAEDSQRARCKDAVRAINQATCRLESVFENLPVPMSSSEDRDLALILHRAGREAVAVLWEGLNDLEAVGMGFPVEETERASDPHPFETAFDRLAERRQQQ